MTSPEPPSARAAVILAAGQGTRMKSPTPKVLHAVGGRSLIRRTRKVFQSRIGRDLTDEDARQIAENITGFFSVLAAWSKAEMPTPANDAGKPVASDDKEVRHDR